MNILRSRVLELTRHQKRAILVTFDFLTLSFILWALLSLRLGAPYMPRDWRIFATFAAAPVLTIIVFAYAGLYRIVTRYLGSRGYTRIVASVALAVLLWSLVVFMSGQYGVPRSVVAMYGVLAAAAITFSRHLIAVLLKSQGIKLPKFDPAKERNPVIIYGAGPAGIELAQALARMPDQDVIGFCDSSPTLWGQYVAGHRVYQPSKLPRAIEHNGVREILLAAPTQDRHERRMILKELEHLPVTVKIMPSLEDLASGRVSVSDLRAVDVGDLLGRDSVPPIGDLLARAVRGKNVLVTGAGGSVGSELVRQVFRQKPAKLILFELSEPALYAIDIELRDIIAAAPQGPHPEVIAVLGSVLDAALVHDTLQRYRVQTIYHAAAYKHVPIVEHNPSVGLSNNIFGTEVVASAAVANNVERMVLISTDKAVRPTNVMGASKRMAELVLQAKAAQNPSTVFTMVRFGNVLDSSGSVVGRFRRQIKSGGPVTVTHPEIIRYFMSIPEAAQLVIQAGAMGHGGDVFVLDMGEPVKIAELARLMVRLSGLEVRDEANPNGDIEIVYTGLRPGEKLYEELLIGSNTTTTEHPQILRSNEPSLEQDDLARELQMLRVAMASNDLENMQSVLLRTVEGYQPKGDIAAASGLPGGQWALPSRTLH